MRTVEVILNQIKLLFFKYFLLNFQIMSSEKTEEPSLEELRQTLRDAEEKLRRIEVRVAAKKKLIEYKNKEKFTITLIERKIKDCQKGNGMN